MTIIISGYCCVVLMISIRLLYRERLGGLHAIGVMFGRNIAKQYMKAILEVKCYDENTNKNKVCCYKIKKSIEYLF